MKETRITLLLILILISIRVSADSIEVAGVVSGIWEVGTVNVTGNIQIREVETLEISPGTLVLFRGDYFFEVRGSLRATGTENQPICFTCDDTTGFYIDSISQGGWKQLRIENIDSSVDSTIIRHCHFSFGKAVAADSIHGYGGAVCVRNTNKVLIQHCTFLNNYAFYSGGAVYLEDATISICNNHFESNHCGQATVYYGYGGGICSDYGEPHIKHNYFTLNFSTGIGGGLSVRYKDCPVTHNIFDNNSSALGGGFSLLHIDTCYWVVSNNLVINNVSQFFGAGISAHDCSPIYVNNTICNNHCAGGGGGLYCKDSVVPVLYNNILYGNTQYGSEPNQVYLWDLLAQPDFYFNDIEGGYESFAGTGGSAFSGNYENNIDEDPLFGFGNYVPEPSSPCVNTGTPDTAGLLIPPLDLAGFNRIVGGTIDMGAYENQEPVFSPQPRFINFELSKPVPNPAIGFTCFSLTIQNPRHIQVKILDAKGNLVELLTDKKLVSGKHKITWNIHPSLDSGNYFAVISSNGHLRVKKVIVP